VRAAASAATALTVKEIGGGHISAEAIDKIVAEGHIHVHGSQPRAKPRRHPGP
jgi:hypothetical protein